MRGSLAMLLEASYLSSLIENGKASPQELAMQRILSPLVKLFTAKEAMKVVSEGIECFGALGYMEDSQLPVFLRDAQVLTIWEGTTNVLCWDLVRALQGMKGGGIEYIAQWLRHYIDMSYLHPSEVLYEKKSSFEFFKKMIMLYHALMPVLETIAIAPSMSVLTLELSPAIQYSLREIVFALCNLIVSVLLLRHFAYNESESNFKTFIGWVSREDFSDPQKIRNIGSLSEEEVLRTKENLYKDFSNVKRFPKASL